MESQDTAIISLHDSFMTLLGGHIWKRTCPRPFLMPLLCRLGYRAILHPLSVPVRAFALATPQRASLPPEAPFLPASLALLDFHASSMHQKCTPIIDFSGFTQPDQKTTKSRRRAMVDKLKQPERERTGTIRGIVGVFVYYMSNSYVRLPAHQ